MPQTAARRPGASDQERKIGLEEALRRGLADDVFGWASPLRPATVARPMVKDGPVRGDVSMVGEVVASRPSGEKKFGPGAFKGILQPPDDTPGSPPISRREILARGGTGFRISVADNPKANGRPPLNEIPSASMVKENDAYIRRAADQHKVDPDLIRAIIYVESTHGWYDKVLSPFDANKSILPMNVNTKYWGDTWGKRQVLKSPQQNINGGARMLRSILNAMPDGDIAQVASVYNDSNTKSVTDYGARVEAVYAEKPWNKVERFNPIKGVHVHKGPGR